MKLSKFTLFMFMFCLSATAFGQKATEKPYQKWSKDEARKMANEKPYADQFQSAGGGGAVQFDTRLSGTDRGSSARNLQLPPVFVRLHSALPVRQAVVRLQAIDAGYDKMNDEDKKKFDESTAKFLDCAICKNYYVITMMKSKNSQMGAVDDGLFQTMTLVDFKGKMHLVNDKGEKRELEQFTPAKGAGDQSVFYFKRLDEKGAPFLTPESTDFKVVFDSELRQKGQYAGLLPPAFEFKVAKIIVDGQVAF
jgi:hypothetical protein